MHKILIVEDDMVIANAIKNHIATWNCEARCVEDFKEVMAEFAAFSPDLVLLDIGLPFFNGYHWARRSEPCQRCRLSLSLLGLGQHEHRHGDEHGRR